MITLSHRTIIESEGPVQFVRTGFDSANKPLVCVCFSRIIIVWVQSDLLKNKWHCISIGESASKFSLSTAITDCIIVPQRAVQANGARFAMVTFQACGDTKRHLLFDDTSSSQSQSSQDSNDSTTAAATSITLNPNPNQTTPLQFPTPIPVPMVNETFRSHEKNSTYTASCVIGDDKLIVGSSNGTIKCWQMNDTWDRANKIYSLKIPSKSNTKKDTDDVIDVWSVTSLTGICGCKGEGRRTSSTNNQSFLSSVSSSASVDSDGPEKDIGCKYLVVGLSLSRSGMYGSEERFNRVVVFNILTKTMLCTMYVRPIVPKLGTRSCVPTLKCISGPCQGCLAQFKQIQETKRKQQEIKRKQQEKQINRNENENENDDENDQDEEETTSYDQKQGLVNATIELLRSRSTRRSHKRRRRGGSKANSSNTYVVLDWRLHFGTGPSVEYLIMRDGDENGGRWAHLLNVKREAESDDLQQYISNTQEENSGSGSQTLVIPQVELYRILVGRNEYEVAENEREGKRSKKTKKKTKPCRQRLTLINSEMISSTTSSSSSLSSSSAAHVLNGGNSAMVEMDAMSWIEGNVQVQTHQGICHTETMSSVVTIMEDEHVDVEVDDMNDFNQEENEKKEKETTATTATSMKTIVCAENGKVYMTCKEKNDTVWKEMILNFQSSNEMEEANTASTTTRGRSVFRWQDKYLETSQWYGIVDLDEGCVVVLSK
jgi:hypothetical protein